MEYIDQHCALSHSKQIGFGNNEKIQNSPDTADLLKDSIRFHLVETDRFKSIGKSRSNLSEEKDQTHMGSAGGKDQHSDDRVAYNVPDKNFQSTNVENVPGPESNLTNSSSHYIKIVNNQSPPPRAFLRIVPKSSSVQKKNLSLEFSTFHLDTQGSSKGSKKKAPKIPTPNPPQTLPKNSPPLSIDSKYTKPQT